MHHRTTLAARRSPAGRTPDSASWSPPKAVRCRSSKSKHFMEFGKSRAGKRRIGTATGSITFGPREQAHWHCCNAAKPESALAAARERSGDIASIVSGNCRREDERLESPAERNKYRVLDSINEPLLLIAKLPGD